MFADMKITRTIISLTVIFFSLHSIAQLQIPVGHFSSPLGIDLLVTGAFGEIRSNHFHSGVDFSVLKKEGLPVYSVADGWVSRIKISPVGFGKALYIDHPGGFTSVYGHLSGYNKAIFNYSRDRQYKEKSFEIDIFPASDNDTLWVRRGEIIGYAGNSGTSYGAHLHFEMRNTFTQRIINPLLFGYAYRDNHSPYIERLSIYPGDDASFFNGSNQAAYLSVVRMPSDEYRIKDRDTLEVWGRFSFGLQAFDYFYSKEDRNGWYSMTMTCDGKTFFTMQVDSFSFAETRYINASIDYADNYRKASRIMCSGKLPGNELSLHQTMDGDGTVHADEGKIKEIVIVVGDLSGKKTLLRLWLKGVKPDRTVTAAMIPDADTTFMVSYRHPYSFETPEILVQIPEGSLYQDTRISYSRHPRTANSFSHLYKIHFPEVPLHKKIRVSVGAGLLPERLQSKALLARKDEKGKIQSAGGAFKDGFVTTETNVFGKYFIVADTIPPSVKLIHDNTNKRKNIRFRVSDNLSGITKYYGEVNGNWALVEWDPKNRLMIYWFDELLKPGKNVVKLFVEDAKGNKASSTTHYLMK